MLTFFAFQFIMIKTTNTIAKTALNPSSKCNLNKEMSYQWSSIVGENNKELYIKAKKDNTKSKNPVIIFIELVISLVYKKASKNSSLMLLSHLFWLLKAEGNLFSKNYN